MRAGIRVATDMDAYLMRRRAALGALTGTVLEIGAGYGANFSYFPVGINWLGLEPDSDRSRHLARMAAAHGHHAPVIAAPAERIPLPASSVDAVVSTHVLCSVTDQHQVLAEVRRVLRPGGVFVFFEHVAAPAGTWSRRLQRCQAPISRRLDAGCDPSRDTWHTIHAAGFDEIHTRWFTKRTRFGLSTPFIAGTAHTGLDKSEEMPMWALRMSPADQAG